MSTTLGTLREYETVFVLNPELTDEQADDVVGRVKDVLEKLGAEILREDRWGKKKTAFEVKKQPRGNYVLLHFVGEGSAIREAERTMRNLDSVLRFMTTLQGDVEDLEAKKVEVERMVRERAQARQEAERREQQQQVEEEAEATAS